MVSIRSVLFVSILLVSLVLSAQQDRYMVFFTDKGETTFSLDHPEEFLTQRALDRRDRMNISLDSMDLPVCKTYLDSLKKLGVNTFFTTKWMNGVIAQMTASQASELEKLSFVANVEYVAPGLKLTYDQNIPPDPTSFVDLVSSEPTTDTQNGMIGASTMHDKGITGEGVYIAILDAGFPGVNEYLPFQDIFLEDRLIATRDFIRNSGNVFQYVDHGASVLSCTGGKYADTFSGVAPGASFVLCVTEDDATEYRVEEYNWLFGAEFSDSLGVDVINSSLGYDTFDDHSMDYSYQDFDGKTTVVARAAQWAADKGIVVVVSAGNTGAKITTPADARDVLTVGSVTANWTKSVFSSMGPTADGRIKPDVDAMGSSTTIFSKNKISTGSGTSYASPQIAGLAAGLLQAYPSLTNLDVLYLIRASGSQYSKPDTLLGYGVANYARAPVGDVITAAEVIKGDITVYPNPILDDHIYLDIDEGLIMDHLDVRVIDPLGRAVYSRRIHKDDIYNQMEISIQTEVSGVYFLTLRSSQIEKTVKLIKN